MPKWKVLITRPATESTEVVVDAPTRVMAHEAALEAAGRYGENLDTWETDSNSHEVYIPDDDAAEELTEEEYDELTKDIKQILEERE